MMKDRLRQAYLPLALLIAIAIAAIGLQPPSPRPVTTAHGAFNLPRALSDLRTISAAPHVVGSPGAANVRAYIVGQMRGMGLDPVLQTGFGVRQGTRGARNIAVAPDTNIVAILPGRDRITPAVLVMAHYDAVPYSFGASDDGAGSVALLETARALVAGPQPARDVIFLVTDGEEAGLTGAQLFFDTHPLAAHVGIVVNAEARGSRGRASMFQTSTGSADLVALWAANARDPQGTSLSAAIYRLLPNDTDLSVSLEKGISGINAAFVDGYFDYHSPTDTLANIDHGTLQQIGDFVLTTSRALAMAPRLPTRGRDSVYFDLFGMMVVQYPPWLGWLPLFGGAALLMLTLRRAPVRPLTLLLATLGVTGLTLLIGAVAHFGMNALYPAGLTGLRERQAEMGSTIWLLAALITGGILLAKPLRAMTIGAVLLLLLVGLTLQILLPDGGFLFGWPALAGAVIIWLTLPSDEQPALNLLSMAIGIAVLALVLMLVQQFYVAVGTMSAGVVALAVPFVIALLAPALVARADDRFARPVGAVLVGASVLFAAWLAMSSGFSARHPQSGDLFALTDARDGKRYWATTSGAARLPGGDAAALARNPFVDQATLRSAPSRASQGQSASVFSSASFAIASADKSPPWTSACVALTDSVTGTRHQLRITSDQPARLFSLWLRPMPGSHSFRVNGKAVDVPTGGWKQINWQAEAPVDLTISYDMSSNSASPGVNLRYLYGVPGTVAGMPPTGGVQSAWQRLSGNHATYGEWPGPAAACNSQSLSGR